MSPTATKTGGIAAALLEVQKNAPELHKDATNPHYKNKYVTLDTVLSAVRPLLNDNGIVVAQLPSYDDEGRPILSTQLKHVESGEIVQADMLLFAPRLDPQGQGSAITYARRYALLAMLGLTADEDDDGNAASEGSSRAGSPRNGSAAEEKKDKAGTGRALGDLSDAELEAATGGKVLISADDATALYNRASAAGYSAQAWKAKVASLGVTGVDDFSRSAAEEIEKWIARKEKKAGKKEDVGDGEETW